MSARKYLNETGLASLWAKIVNKINAVGDTCVKKIGDTITGTLFLTTSSSIQVKTNIDKEVIPTEDIAKVLYNFRDKNDNNIGVLQARQYKDVGNIATIIGANREVNGTTYFNQLALSLTPTGGKVVQVSDKPSWRSAIGAVSKSGDTMTGELVTSAGKVAMGSGMSNASTIEALVEDLRFTNGCAGSVYITTPYKLNGIEIPAEWYHYFYAPHRSGGYNGGIHPTQEDNTLYGCIILSDLFGNSERSYIIHFIRQGSTAYPTIKTVKKLMCDEPTTKLTQHGEGHNRKFTKLYEQLNENGSIRAYMEQSSNPDNISYCDIGVRGYWSDDTLARNVYIGVSCNHTTNHTPGYILSHPKAFLDSSTSVGKLTSLTYAIKNTTYVNSAATSYVRYVRSGHIVNVFYAFSTAGALTNRWSTLFSGLPKPVDSLFINGEGDRLAVSTAGVMQNVYTTSAATFSRGTFTYITDDFN